ncbi:hypothetical protein FRC03_012391 [Tulasnella sp. 419]|nr:hypothetical protein FRC03_012391 [Tulasnella sp. 419]
MRDTHRSDWDSQDICAAQAVIWLLWHSEHPNTTIAALDAALRLPSDLLLSLIIQRQGLDMRLFHFYSSLIPPHPRSFMSWVASWDDRAVICGMAILHIFTQPSFANPSIRSLRLGIGHQFIDYGYECVTEGNHALILRALVGFLFNPHLDPSWLSDILGKIQDPHYVAQLQVNLPDGRHSSLVSSITTTVPLCYLAFDVFTFIALTYSLDGFCKRTLPDVCNLARNVLTNSSSATVVSRIAITVGAGLWCIQVGTRRRRNPSWNLASSQNLKEVESLLITGTRAVDKGNMVIDNVALLLSLVDEESLGDEELIGCASLLHTLLTYTKNGFIQRSSLVSERPHFVDHLLLLSRSCRDDSSAQSTILEILCARWDTFMENHWEDFYLLVNHASTFPPLVTNLIRHLATYSGDEAFLQLFLSRDGLLSDPDHYSTLFPIQRPPFWRALRLSSTDPIILSNQIIVVLDCLAHSDGSRGASSSDEWIDQAECTVAFLTRMTETNTELEWPSYFSAGEMMALALKGTGYRQALQHLVPSWCGEFVILLWRGAHNWCAVGTLRDDWGDSAFFRKEIIDLMLEYHQFVKEKGYIGLDLNTLGGYLEQALRRVSRTQGDKQSLTQPDGYSNNVDEPNENHIDCSPAHNPEETSRKIVTDTKVVEDPEQEERHRRIIQALESLVFPSINS